MENNNVPPPASSLPLPPGVSGQMPLPVGEPMVLNNPTGDERAALEKVGWSDLPAEEQEKYYEILRSALTHAREATEQPQQVSDAPVGVNEAIQAASGLVLEDDTGEEEYSTGEAKPAPVEHVHDPIDPLCPQCGWDSREGSPIEVTDVDKTNFLQALLGQTQFYKEYLLFGGNISLTVRTLKPAEVDACFKQVMIDAQVGRILTQADEQEALLRYRASLQVVSVIGQGLDISFPGNLDEWTIEEDNSDDSKLYLIQEMFQSKVGSSETMHRLIVGTVARFNTVVARLEVNSNNPDFWQAIGSDS